jgi:hypothetical protein
MAPIKPTESSISASGMDARREITPAGDSDQTRAILTRQADKLLRQQNLPHSDHPSAYANQFIGDCSISNKTTEQGTQDVAQNNGQGPQTEQNHHESGTKKTDQPKQKSAAAPADSSAEALAAQRLAEQQRKEALTQQLTAQMEALRGSSNTKLALDQIRAGIGQMAANNIDSSKFQGYATELEHKPEES